MSTYDVTVTRGEGVWVVEVAGLPESYFPMTQVERFSDLDVEAVDLIAGLTETDPGTIEVRWHFAFGGNDVTTAIHQLRAVESQLHQLEDRRDTLRRRLIRQGRGAGLSQSVVGDALGISQQRVNQLEKVAAGE